MTDYGKSPWLILYLIDDYKPTSEQMHNRTTNKKDLLKTEWALDN